MNSDSILYPRFEARAALDESQIAALQSLQADGPFLPLSITTPQFFSCAMVKAKAMCTLSTKVDSIFRSPKRAKRKQGK